MRLVATSDTHGRLPEISLPEGDVLILAGDILRNFYMDKHQDASRQLVALRELLKFLDGSRFKKVVLVAGNHDWCFELRRPEAKALVAEYPKVSYLEDQSVEIEGVKLYGSPWQPAFFAWAFNLPRCGKELRAAWSRISDDTQVLVTHGPPYGTLDIPRLPRSPNTGQHVGCELLRDRVAQLKQLKLHVFGHIHSSYGVEVRDGVTYANVALCGEDYRPTQAPFVFDV